MSILVISKSQHLNDEIIDSFGCSIINTDATHSDGMHSIINTDATHSGGMHSIINTVVTIFPPAHYNTEMTSVWLSQVPIDLTDVIAVFLPIISTRGIQSELKSLPDRLIAMNINRIPILILSMRKAPSNITSFADNIYLMCAFVGIRHDQQQKILKLLGLPTGDEDMVNRLNSLSVSMSNARDPGDSMEGL